MSDSDEIDRRAALLDRVELPMIRAMWQIPTKELRGVALLIGETGVTGRFLYEKPPGELENELVSLCEFYLAIDVPDDYDVDFHAEYVPMDQDLINREGERWFFLRYEDE